MAFGSSDFSSSSDDVSKSVEDVIRYIQGVVPLELRKSGNAGGTTVDEAGNSWTVEVYGEPDIVEQFATQNDNAPIEYNLTYTPEDDPGEPLPEGDEDEEPPTRGEGEVAPLEVHISLDLSAETVDEYGNVDLEIVIDPPIGFGQEHAYLIAVKKPASATWKNFAVGYEAEGGIDVIPVSSSLSETEIMPSLEGHLAASSQANAYQFKVSGTHEAGSMYRLFPRGRVSLVHL